MDSKEEFKRPIYYLSERGNTDKRKKAKNVESTDDDFL